MPVWNPLDWDFTSFGDVLERRRHGELGAVFVRTLVYVGVALLICFLIGYPVAYYVARFAGRRRGLLLALLLAPFWISYLMRMLAWVNLLQDGRLRQRRHRRSSGSAGSTGSTGGRSRSCSAWSTATCRSSCSRCTPPSTASTARLLEASRDLGMGRLTTFVRVTLPLSRQGMLAAAVITALPMIGDYYTADLLSGLAAHEHDRQPDRVLPVQRLAEGGRRVARAHPLGPAAGG